MDVPCRKCPKCLQFRQMQWRERAIAEIASAPRTWMVTLTFAPLHMAGVISEAHKLKAPEAFKGRLDRAAYGHVQKYLKRLRKASRRKLRYLAVYEEGEETGRSHYHLLLHEVDGPISKRQIEGQWRSNVHARLVALDAGTGPASYITKYATKSLDIRPRASARYGQGSETSAPLPS